VFARLRPGGRGLRTTKKGNRNVAMATKSGEGTRLGTETWIVGTWDQIKMVRDAINAVAVLIQVSECKPMVGADSGRYRQYLRVGSAKKEEII
jgi:hypothetical protein